MVGIRTAISSECIGVYFRLQMQPECEADLSFPSVPMLKNPRGPQHVSYTASWRDTNSCPVFEQMYSSVLYE
jgi:hypothetical protein